MLSSVYNFLFFYFHLSDNDSEMKLTMNGLIMKLYTTRLTKRDKNDKVPYVQDKTKESFKVKN